MKLIKLQIKNFAGLADKTVMFGDRETIIAGKNGSGKSTLKNAFCWVMGVDANIKPRPIKADGTTDYSVIPDVILTMANSDGDILEIERKLNVTRDMLGGIKETSVFIVDGFETSKKAYVSQIQTAMRLDDVAYNFILNPEMFVVNSSASDRRTALLDLLSLHDADFLDDEIKEALKGYTVEEALGMLKKGIKAAETELKTLPAQLKEAQRGVVEITETKEELQARADELAAKIALMEKDGGRADRLTEATAAYETAGNELRNKTALMKSDIDYAEKSLNAVRQTIDATAQNLVDLENERNNLKSEYFKLKESDYQGTTTCPTCGHELPDALLVSYIEKFNKEKAAKLEVLKNKGLNITNKIKMLEDQLSTAKTQEAAKVQELEILERDRKEEIEQLKVKVAELETAMKQANEAYNGDIFSNPAYTELVRQRGEAVTKMLKIDISNEQKARCTELENQIEEARKKYEDLLLRQNKIMDARRQIGDRLEAAVNEKFKYIQWKLTETLKSGETADCCSPLVEGVSYLGSLNSGAKILALCDCYNVVVSLRHDIPLWIDNAEQVTSFDPVKINGNGQIIKLRAENKPLTIEGE